MLPSVLRAPKKTIFASLMHENTTSLIWILILDYIVPSDKRRKVNIENAFCLQPVG
jgi:hypothetical protein